MTNAEKYQEVFGIEPDTVACPTKQCFNCPNYDPNRTPFKCTETWWQSEYKR